MKNKLLWAALSLIIPIWAGAQGTFPVNGVNNPQTTRYTFINANIQVSPQKLIYDGILEIENGKIKAVKASGEKYDTTAIIIDLKGNYIYPSFIDIYSDYGVPSFSEKKKKGRGEPQDLSDKKGAYGWNEAIKPETEAYQLFAHDEKAAEAYRQAGFGTVATFVQDGIARGTSAIVTLSDEAENKSIITQQASANYSFNKGSSQQTYPTSLMGAVALLRQTLYDAQAYQQGTLKETNLSLQALNQQQQIPQVFEAGNKWDMLRIQNLAREFGKTYIIKTHGDEYQNINSWKNSNAQLIVPINFPDAVEVKSYFDAANLRYTDLRHRDAAPFNPYILQQNKVPFAFTAEGLKDKKEFLKNIREAIEHGLSTTTALEALTTNPAKFLKVDDKVGTIEKGKLASFIITSENLFAEDNILLENWVQGKQFILNQEPPYFLSYNYKLFIDDKEITEIKIGLKKDNKVNIVTFPLSKSIDKINYSAVAQQISFIYKSEKDTFFLSGWKEKNNLWGTGNNQNGKTVRWEGRETESYDSAKTQEPLKIKTMPAYPALPYNYANKNSNTFWIRGATVWTNTKEGVLQNADVLVINGKVAAVGEINGQTLQKFGLKNVPTISGIGKHLTTGIIDEHSHIAIMGGVNESSQSSTAEVRIGDVINPEDINIYRQLAGGVTTSQLLHGSANTIGGQSAVIKLKWGTTPDSMVFADAPQRIKFALGENVKQSNWGEKFTERFPQTRMGVQQVFEDFFTQAREYEKAWADYKTGKTKQQPRKNIELEALLEVVNGKRLITCHSYSQQEINMLMKTAEKFGFTVNIFTHVLEGYKIADKLKEHGAGASTFSDWWGYKYEVIEATPYNAALLNEAGVITCINSDDAEMGRRLNQEAAKTVKYGGVSEEDALKMITLNPAKLMKIENRVGSIALGKDADLVLWSGHPLSIYSKPIKTFIEGVAYFDAAQHTQAEAELLKIKQELIEKNRQAAAKGKKASPPKKEEEHTYHCDDETVYTEEGDQ